MSSKSQMIASKNNIKLIEYLIEKLEKCKGKSNTFVDLFSNIQFIEQFYDNQNYIVRFFRNLEEDLNQAIYTIKAMLIENKEISMELDQKTKEVKLLREKYSANNTLKSSDEGYNNIITKLKSYDEELEMINKNKQSKYTAIKKKYSSNNDSNVNNCNKFLYKSNDNMNNRTDHTSLYSKYNNLNKTYNANNSASVIKSKSLSPSHMKINSNNNSISIKIDQINDYKTKYKPKNSANFSAGSIAYNKSTQNQQIKRSFFPKMSSNFNSFKSFKPSKFSKSRPNLSKNEAVDSNLYSISQIGNVKDILNRMQKDKLQIKNAVERHLKNRNCVTDLSGFREKEEGKYKLYYTPSNCKYSIIDKNNLLIKILNNPHLISKISDKLGKDFMTKLLKDDCPKEFYVQIEDFLNENNSNKNINNASNLNNNNDNRRKKKKNLSFTGFNISNDGCDFDRNNNERCVVPGYDYHKYYGPGYSE